MSQFAFKCHKNKAKKSKLKQNIMRLSKAAFQDFCPIPRLYAVIVL